MRLLHLKERYHLIHGMVHSNTSNGTIQYIEGTVCISYHNPSFAEISSIR